jgi:uncharacterized iron-regulated membrane protein
VRGLILKIHLMLGLIAGAFLALLGVTGSILAFEPELDRLLHSDVSYVTPGERFLSLTEIGESVSRTYRGEAIVAFLPSTSPRFPAQVVMSRGIVSVNQYTGAVLGVRTRGQTFFGWVRALHVRLAVGDIGRNALRWSAVAMLFSIFSGLYLWWPIKRVGIRGSWMHGRFWSDLHNSVGIFSLLPWLVLAVTGTVIGFEDQMAKLLDKLTGATPIRADRGVVRSEAAVGATEITPDQAVAVASARLPGAVPSRVQMPRYGGVYIVSLEFPDHRIAGGSNSFSIDPWSGEIIAADLSMGLTTRERLLAMDQEIHTGEVLGIPGRVMVALAGIFLPLQILTGLVIWLRRVKRRNNWSLHQGELQT